MNAAAIRLGEMSFTPPPVKPIRSTRSDTAL